MLDRMTTADLGSFSIVVHRQVPAMWPSARDATTVVKRHIFQTREFIQAWMATRGARRSVTAYFVEVRHRSGGPIMLLPMTITIGAGGRTLGFMDGGLADYNAPVLMMPGLYWTEDAARALWGKILAELPAHDLIRIENMPETVDGEQNPLALLGTAANDESSHGSDLTPAWERIEATQEQVKRLKQKWRSLEKVGPVTLRIAETEVERDRFLAKALAQKQRRFDDTKVNGFDRDPDKLAYFQLATKIFDGVGALHVSALLVGDEVVATSWNLCQGKVVQGILMGFEGGEWAKYSCGRILNLMLLRRLKEIGFSYLDHGIGDEGWKLTSCDTHVPLRMMVEPRSLRGRLMLLRAALKQRVRGLKAWQVLQPIKWALLRKLSRGVPSF